MEIRNLEQTDLPILKQSGLDTTSLIRLHHRVHLALIPGIVGLVSWRLIPSAHSATFTAIFTTDRAPDDTFLRLSLFAIYAMLAEHVTHFNWETSNAHLAAQLTRLYNVTYSTIGVSPLSRQPVKWEGSHDAEAAAAVLQGLLAVPPP